MLDGGLVEVTSEPVRHHDSAFFRWTMTDKAGATVLSRLGRRAARRHRAASRG
jgi:hypothetical protein